MVLAFVLILSGVLIILYQFIKKMKNKRGK
jgi:hypothetical protein